MTAIKILDKIEIRKPSDLIPYTNNAKLHSQDQINDIAGQIAAFGFDQPILVDSHNVIIKGHGRREAAIKLNMDAVPVIVTTLDEYQAMAARIADNKVPSIEYNIDKLKFELGTLKNKDFNMKLTGMKPLELNSLLPSDNQSKQIFSTDAPPPPSKEQEEKTEEATEEGGGYFMDRNPIIQYNIVFDDKVQQETWHSFLTTLKETHPEINTVAGRVIEFINAHQETS